MENNQSFNIKIFIESNGDVTITSLFKDLLPLLKELSGISQGDDK